MSKKIKYIISIIIGLILLGITNSVFGYYTQNSWNNRPNSLYPILTNNGYIYYCKQKGGALRLYTPPTNPDDWTISRE